MDFPELFSPYLEKNDPGDRFYKEFVPIAQRSPLLADGLWRAAAVDPERAATVRAILKLAHELKIGVVTEGVETETQRDRSAETSIIAQGHFFSKAVDVEEAARLLRQGRIGGGEQPPEDLSLSSILRRRHFEPQTTSEANGGPEETGPSVHQETES